MESTQPSETEDEGFTVVTKKNLKRKSPKNYDFDGDQGVENNESSKKAAVSELQPVIIQSESSKKMVSYNPISVDYGLRKAIGSYEFCKPLRNGNLMVKCNNVSQIKTLVNLTEIFDAAGNKISIITSVMAPPGAKGIIRNVPITLCENEILEILKPQKVKYVKRFQLKPKDYEKTNEMQSSTTVLLHFTCSDLPEKVVIGYMSFKTQIYIPKPLRCFKCNRFGHVASKCKNKDRCSRCGGEHTWKTCENNQKCVNCGGNHSAASKICPKYAKEAEIIKIKVTNKISYAEACKQVNKANVTKPALNHSQSSSLQRPAAGADIDNFPPLPCKSGTGTKPMSSTTVPQQGSENAEPHGTQIDSVQMDEVDFTSNFMFANPIYFIAFLTEVINQTIACKDQNKTIDIFQIISDAAGRRMGLPIDINQLKNIIN